MNPRAWLRLGIRGGLRAARWAACIAALACGGPEPRVDLDGLARACLDASTRMEPLELRVATNFSWQKLYVFGPYTTMDQIESTLGFAWDPASTSGIAERDDVTLLVFVDEGEVVHWLLQPRNLGDFSEIVAPSGLTPEAARFAVRRLDPPLSRCLVLPIE